MLPTTAQPAISHTLQSRFDQPLERHDGFIGFWNWNRSCFIQVGKTEKEIIDDLNAPHFPEDSLGLGHLND